MKPALSAPSIISFDARAMIAAGEEPLTEILTLSDTLADGDVLDVVAPFDPRPLYEVLHARGYRVPAQGTELTPGAWHAQFTRVDISPSHTITTVRTRHPATGAVFATLGMDTCCGGTHALSFAAAAHGVEVARLMTLLTSAALEVEPSELE